MKQEFRFSPGGFKVIRKRVLIRVVPVILVFATLGVLLPSFSNSTYFDDYTIAFVAPFVLALMGFSLWRGLKKQQESLESFVLTIEDNVITRQQLNMEEVSIYFHEIEAIAKNKLGVIVIRGLDNDVICVPAQVERYEELEKILGEQKSFGSMAAATTRSQKLGPYLALLGIVAMITLIVSDNKIVVGIAGPLTIAFYTWNLVQIRKNKNIDVKTKRNSWFTLFVIFAMLGMTLVKLFSPEMYE